MIVFGKKCPACGGRQLTARQARCRLGKLPTAQAYDCARCRQQMVYLFPFSIGVEHRAYARKELPSFFLIRIPGRTSQYARLKNISEGGLCFNQNYNAIPLPDRMVRLDLYNCSDGSSLESLSAEVVCSFEQHIVIRGIATTVVNNCARFVGLNQAQRKVLQRCLSRYGRPAPTGMATISR
ncbi:MAG: PilZ domain-containing protein [Desulfobulbus sp.]|jgi:hypothetical protein